MNESTYKKNLKSNEVWELWEGELVLRFEKHSTRIDTHTCKVEYIPDPPKEIKNVTLKTGSNRDVIVYST